MSPDGRWLVFDSDRGGNADLYVMPAAGGEARQITTDPAGDFSGDWSPDGRRSCSTRCAAEFETSTR